MHKCKIQNFNHFNVQFSGTMHTHDAVYHQHSPFPDPSHNSKWELYPLKIPPFPYPRVNRRISKPGITEKSKNPGAQDNAEGAESSSPGGPWKMWLGPSKRCMLPTIGWNRIVSFVSVSNIPIDLSQSV